MAGVADALPSGPAKADMALQLGDAELLLPVLIRRGLSANDRAKYYLALLQEARARADDPGRPIRPLRDERLAAGITDASLDVVVERAEAAGPGTYLIPGAGRIHADLVAAVEEMLAPLPAGGPAGPDRLAALVDGAPDLGGDLVPGGYLDRATARGRPGRDSLHQLIMDSHRALNRALEDMAGETVAGAAAYGLTAEDRGALEAFMSGVNSTSPLRLDHPGLATSAIRAGDRLLIQNDLGTTAAHVVVVAVAGLDASITYTDVHRKRLQFFTSLLDGCGVGWSPAARGRGGPSLGGYHMSVGRYRAVDRSALEEALRCIGSRLVFVLDWNRARKRLETFLPPAEAQECLRWAADHDVGHMAFLALDGERLIHDAVELSARVPVRYGEPVVEVLGPDATVDVTRFAMKAASDGVLTGKSRLLIRDEIRVEVLRHVQASHRRLLDSSAEHASLIVETAAALHGAVLRLGSEEGRPYLERAAGRAARWEHRADEILTEQRRAGHRVDGSAAVTRLTAFADDGIDAIEEALSLLTLLPDGAAPAVRPTLDPLAGVAASTAREYLKAVEIALRVLDGRESEELEDFLVAVDRVSTLEHAADEADRAARATLVRESSDFRSLYVADGVCRSTEEATDALLRSALGLRDHVISVLASR